MPIYEVSPDHSSTSNDEINLEQQKIAAELHKNTTTINELFKLNIFFIYAPTILLALLLLGSALSYDFSQQVQYYILFNVIYIIIAGPFILFSIYKTVSIIIKNATPQKYNSKAISVFVINILIVLSAILLMVFVN